MSRDMHRKPASEPVLTCLEDVKFQPIQWLWPGRIALGCLTVLAGRPGEGKSILTTYMAARVSTGTPWPDGAACPLGTVILINDEDDPGNTIRPRLDAHHGDVSKVHWLSMVRRIGTDGKAIDSTFTLADVAALEVALQRHPDCRLVVVDPIGSYLGWNTDAHRDNEVRSVLGPVAELYEAICRLPDPQPGVEAAVMTGTDGVLIGAVDHVAALDRALDHQLDHGRPREGLSPAATGCDTTDAVDACLNAQARYNSAVVTHRQRLAATDHEIDRNSSKHKNLRPSTQVD